MSDTTRALPPQHVEGPAGIELVVISGPDEGQRIAIAERHMVGTSERCDLRLTDPTVSRRHLEVIRSGVGVRVVDTQSRNGTWLGSAQVHDVELGPGAELRIGGSTLRVETGAPRVEEQSAESYSSFGRFRGEAASLRVLYRQLHRVAATDATVLLEGESGTGKELLSEAIHEQSSRTDGPFVVVDCGSVPESLIESELFGHVRGAFTGATSAHTGAFERADGGTIFLDEIGELPLAMQTRLLRALDRKRIRPVGGQDWKDVDVRVVAATNRNLEHEVEESRFRLDLLHRLSVIQLRVPPLRERREDIPRLARGFATQLGADPDELVPQVERRAQGHSFPGNVRELRNLVERLALLGADAQLTPAATATTEELSFASLTDSGMPYRVARARVLGSFNRAYAEAMLKQHDGNVSQAARSAGVARRHFYRLRDDNED